MGSVERQPRPAGRGRGRRRMLLVLAGVLLALAVGWGAYVGDYYAADEAALAALAGTGAVQVRQTEEGIVFAPEDPVAGLLFYPGGKVEPAAYGPLMLALAERGVLCVILPMPWNLAVLDPEAAAGVPARFPEVGRWYIGGHSLGGSMAAVYAGAHPEELEGLVLLAAYSTADLTGTDLGALCVYGSEDGVLNMEQYRRCRENLPPDTAELCIPGGCHAGFGSYGPQDGDGVPSISTAEQIRHTAEGIVEFIDQRQRP